MARKRRRERVDFEHLLQDLEQTYQKWKPHEGFPGYIVRKGRAFSGSFVPGTKPKEEDIEKVFYRFDKAIMNLVASNKLALGEPRVLERIRQAQSVGEWDFFDELAGAIKKNIGFDRRMANDPAVFGIHYCAVKFLHGDKKFIREEYHRWEKMEIEKRRQEKPGDQKFQSHLDHLAKIKASITKGNLESFRAKVKRMVEQLQRGSMPIPILGNKD